MRSFEEPSQGQDLLRAAEPAPVLRWSPQAALLLAVVLLATACGGGARSQQAGGAPPPPPAPPDLPVSLVDLPTGYHWVALPEESQSLVGKWIPPGSDGCDDTLPYMHSVKNVCQTELTMTQAKMRVWGYVRGRERDSDDVTKYTLDASLEAVPTDAYRACCTRNQSCGCYISKAYRGTRTVYTRVDTLLSGVGDGESVVRIKGPGGQVTPYGVHSGAEQSGFLFYEIRSVEPIPPPPEPTPQARHCRRFSSLLTQLCEPRPALTDAQAAGAEFDATEVRVAINTLTACVEGIEAFHGEARGLLDRYRAWLPAAVAKGNGRGGLTADQTRARDVLAARRDAGRLTSHGFHCDEEKPAEPAF